MLKKFKLLTVNKQMLIIAAFLIVFNFVAVVFLDLAASRVMRVISSLVVFVYFYLFLRCNCKWLDVVLVLIIITNICVVFYNYDYGVLWYTITSVLAYSILGFKSLFEVEWLKIKWYEYFTYALIFIFNLYTFDYLMGIISPLFDERWMFYMIKLLGITGTTMCLVSGFYHTTRLGFKSAYFMYATFGFVFSDFAAMLAYYFEMVPQLFFILDRGLHLFALYFLMRYAYMVKLEQEVFSN
jgi:hypothetical protein